MPHEPCVPGSKTESTITSFPWRRSRRWWLPVSLWAEVHGNCYGTARKQIEEACSLGADILLDIDVQGAAQLRASGLDGVYIFILPPNLAELRRRLVGRNSDSEAIIARRLDNAAGEIAEAGHFDYLVVNSDLEQAVGTVQAIMQAEKHRTVRAIGGLPVEFGLK